MKIFYILLLALVLHSCGTKEDDKQNFNGTGGVGVGVKSSYASYYSSVGYQIEFLDGLTISEKKGVLSVSDSALIKSGEAPSLLTVRSFSDPWFEGKEYSEENIVQFLKEQYSADFVNKTSLPESIAYSASFTVGQETRTIWFTYLVNSNLFLMMEMQEPAAHSTASAELVKAALTIKSFR